MLMIIKKVIPFFLFCLIVYANTPQGVVDCNIIFEQRKAEILQGIEKIDEQQQALQALQSANQAVLDKREAALAQKEKEIQATMEAITLKETKIKQMMAENEETLKAIKQAKDNKIADTYTNMKDSKAAPIIEQLNDAQAATILFNLDSKVMSKILAKMTPERAAELTKILQKGPPFDATLDTQKDDADSIKNIPAFIPSVPGQSTQEDSI